VLHRSYNNWQTAHIAASHKPGNLKFTPVKKLKHYYAFFVISEHVCMRTMMYVRIIIHGQMDVTSLPDFLQRRRKASRAIPGPYKIPTSAPYNPPEPLHRMPFGASCRLPIGCIGRQRHPPQSGYRTRAYSVGPINEL